MMQEMLLLLALDEFDRQPLQRAQKSESFLDAARDRMEREFSLPLNMSELAEVSGLSRNYFTMRFRERFGRTPQSYLLHLRIEKARLLLISTNLPVKEIAFECGLPDPNHFNKQFRMIVGQSPSAYRARYSAK